MDERNITDEDVRREHMASVNAPAHWLYMIGVLAVSFLLMIGLIALLGGTT